MTRKTATPIEITQALALREVGYTALSISQELGISVRSLQRHFAVHGTKKGKLKQEVLDSARAELMKRVTSDDAIREEAARLINDDLAHARHLRILLVAASEQLQATTLQEAVLVMRAAAAYSVVIKNTSDTIRQKRRVDKVIEDVNEDLPELTIRELTSEEVSRLRNIQKDESGFAEPDETIADDEVVMES
jgi:AraC-like DNA-binding protein